MGRGCDRKMGPGAGALATRIGVKIKAGLTESQCVCLR